MLDYNVHLYKVVSAMQFILDRIRRFWQSYENQKLETSRCNEFRKGAREASVVITIGLAIIRLN